MKESVIKQAHSMRRAVPHALRITGIYLLLGILWIIFSDTLLQRLATSQAMLVRLQSVKGVVFVLVTAVIIYILLHRLLVYLYQVNQELNRSREQHQGTADYLKRLFEAAPLAVFDLDPQGRVKSLWNRAAEEIFAWSREEVLGQRNPLVPEEQTEEYLRLFSDVMEGRQLVNVELSRQRKDGVLLTISLSAVPLYGTDGQVTGALAMVSDITDKRRREEALQQALEEKKVLLREVHHRVKNNLQVIISLLNMKEELVEEPADREIFFGILGRVEAMALIHDKLYQSEGLEQIDFDQYLRELCSNLALEFAAQRRGIDMRYSGEKAVVEINRAVPLGLLVNELLTNALRHAFPDGRGGTVRMSLEQNGDSMLLRVKDDGVGLPEEMLRGSDDPERTGLNLAYLFAEQVGGALEISSREGTEAVLRCCRS